eukprot:CAMPEP_0167788660 /NCGR_PEP_ID=MMETSP0111_2-20121227/10172_1 /TAXON_ID=91324 /ORGANISM="Lotharella globosa, Strain CCCM811" /LENGTH=410 /DNA_ID=CAMNT_0007680579 /DNA_START=120 /DNA_END=1352 /DNA_ORIENTATION=+
MAQGDRTMEMKERGGSIGVLVDNGSTAGIKTMSPPDPVVEEQQESKNCCQCILEEFWGKRFFLYMLIISIAVAAAYPPAGRKKGPLLPPITVSWVAVVLIFFITGLKLKSAELTKAAAYWRLNVYVICFTYIFIPSTVYILTSILRQTAYNSDIIDGMVVMSCLPTTISMCVILTKTGSGNEAASVFNATVSNFLGIFLTPALLLLLLGQSGSVSIVNIIYKLAARVVAPVAFGQFLRWLLPSIIPWVSRNGKALKRLSEILLLFIVWATFSETFYQGVDAKPEEFGILLAMLIPLHCFYLLFCFTTARISCLGYTRPDIVAVLFCSTQKTVALGIPLISAMYEDSDSIGILSVPLLIYHPMQLVIGSLLVGKLSQWATEDTENETPGEQDIPEGPVSMAWGEAKATQEA